MFGWLSWRTGMRLRWRRLEPTVQSISENRHGGCVGICADGSLHPKDPLAILVGEVDLDRPHRLGYRRIASMLAEQGVFITKGTVERLA